MGVKELGSSGEAYSATFCLDGEDHTLGNSLRYILNKDPRVIFAGYSVPHPSENIVNIRLQTTGAPAKEVLKDALADLISICQHVNSTFDAAVDKFRRNQAQAGGEVSGTQASDVMSE